MSTPIYIGPTSKRGKHLVAVETIGSSYRVIATCDHERQARMIVAALRNYNEIEVQP